MSFKGHILVVLEQDIKTKDTDDKRIKYTSWVLDKTDFCIYSVKLDKDRNILSKQLVGKMMLDRRLGLISFVKIKPIPVKILKRAEKEAIELYKLIEGKSI